MVHPNESFPINIFAGQPGVSGADNQSSETNLFASWFANSVPSGQELSFPFDHEAYPHQFVALREQLMLMMEQMTVQNSSFE
ncbi:hypothetical protein J1N35_043166 [Gossypium stocksii]|uniref:Uncharacterized protein n=1 Tax=Gossypium stocksii TaxID=47602 RepID=A0A9D3U6X5_9ROSI|nr:hypothetical protein J1N35_043166 [Gossypium stocksii]